MSVFYETIDGKKERLMEQTGTDESSVMALLDNWREEQYDIGGLLQEKGAARQTQQSIPGALPRPLPVLSQSSVDLSLNQSTTNSSRQNHQDLQMYSQSSINGNPNQRAATSPRPMPQGLPLLSQASIDLSLNQQSSSAANDVTSNGDRMSYSNNMMNRQPSNQVPTFASRPSVLNLSAHIKYEDSSGQNQVSCEQSHMKSGMSSHGMSSDRSNASPHRSPHHSPYLPNNSTNVFNYSSIPDGARAMTHSPHHVMHSPHHEGQMSPYNRSPVSPYNQNPVSPHCYPQRSVVSPVSPHATPNHSRSVSPHVSQGPVSPCSTHSGSVSPVPHRQYSPIPCSSVFGRYAGSPVPMSSATSTPDDDSMMHGYEYDANGSRKRHSSMSSDKSTDMYKAKRERNNIAVRKSREKKKQREMEIESKVKQLSDENSALQSKLDSVVNEMKLMKSLYKNIGLTLPAEARMKLETELAKFN